MSLKDVKNYITPQLVNLGFAEWEEAFDENNLPSTIIDRSFHQRVVSISGGGINQETIEYNMLMQVKLYFKAFTDTDGGVDTALTESEAVIKKVLNVPDYSTAGLNGVFLDSIDVSPFDNESNDNIVVSTIQFNVRVFQCLYN